jgi:hypothetical protein
VYSGSSAPAASVNLSHGRSPARGGCQLIDGAVAVEGDRLRHIGCVPDGQSERVQIADRKQ